MHIEVRYSNEQSSRGAPMRATMIVRVGAQRMKVSAHGRNKPEALDRVIPRFAQAVSDAMSGRSRTGSTLTPLAACKVYSRVMNGDMRIVEM